MLREKRIACRREEKGSVGTTEVDYLVSLVPLLFLFLFLFSSLSIFTLTIFTYRKRALLIKTNSVHSANSGPGENNN